jgi:hypothetical protein
MNFLEFVQKRELNKKLIDTYGKYKVYYVNGEAVRSISQSANEFIDFAIHDHFPDIIPKNEIWIDEIVKRPNDLLVFISQCLYEQKLIDRKEKDTYKKALKMAKKTREILDGLPFHPNKPVSKKIYISKYGTIDDGIDKITVWLVNGEIVRDEFKTDYVEGGNDAVYKWIPKNEIWIEDTMLPEEIPLIIIHEFVERELMKYKKMSYNKAHAIASKVDFKYYNKKFTKQDALSLNKDRAFALAKEFG